jgi:hypothetical protein
MQARLTTKPQQEVIAAIQGLDLESVKLRVMDPELGEGWSQEYADGIEVAYKNYLVMLTKYPDDIEDILISKDVDEFWHAHILHTKKYADDCQKIFGNFLHHDPQPRERSSAEIQKRSALVEKTHHLYQQESGNRRNANAAYCNAAVRADEAAYCNAAIRARDVSYCNATLRAENAAYCNATVQGENLAYCNASVRTDNAAYCNAAVGAGNAAYCNAALGADKAAYCNAGIRSGNAAHCESSPRPMSAKLYDTARLGLPAAA